MSHKLPAGTFYNPFWKKIYNIPIYTAELFKDDDGTFRRFNANHKGIEINLRENITLVFKSNGTIEIDE